MGRWFESTSAQFFFLLALRCAKMRMTAKGLSPLDPGRETAPSFSYLRYFFPIRAVLFPIRTSLREDANDGQGAFAPGPRCTLTVVEGCGKPARPPALQVRRSRVRANRIIIAGQGSQRGRQLHIKSEVDDISIVHDVLFALRSHLPIFFGFNFASCGNEIVVGNDFRSDVSALEV